MVRISSASVIVPPVRPRRRRGRPIKSHNSDTFRTLAILLIAACICFCNSYTRTLVPQASAQDVPDAADLFFNLNEDSIQPEGESLLRERASLLKSSPDLILVIDGYSDVTGEDEYNLSLSRRRAESVRSYFIGQGIEPQRIRARGNGKTDKFSAGLGEESLRRNRRVRITFDTARIEAEPFVSEEKKDVPSGTLPPVEEDISQAETTEEIDSAVEADAEPLPPALAQPEAPPHELSEAIEGSMKKLAPGRIVFETPGRMSVGETYTIEADLSFSFLRDMSKSLNTMSDRGLNRLRLGQDVGVRLSGHGFDIRPVREDDGDGSTQEEAPGGETAVIKNLNENSAATWLWRVTPLKSGFRSLLLSVEVMVEDSRYNNMVSEYPIFQRVIEVKPSFLYSVTSSYWIMAVFIIIVVAAVGWILIRKLRVG